MSTTETSSAGDASANMLIMVKSLINDYETLAYMDEAANKINKRSRGTIQSSPSGDSPLEIEHHSILGDISDHSIVGDRLCIWTTL